MDIEHNAPTAADLELKAIEREASAIELEQRIALDPTDPAAQPAPPPADPVEDAREIIEFACVSIFPLYPSLENVYTPSVRDRIAHALSRVLVKYGVTLADIFGAWSEEIALAMVTLPLVIPTIQAIKADRAKAEAKAAPGAGYDPKSDYPGGYTRESQAEMQAKAADAPPVAPNPMERFAGQ